MYDLSKNKNHLTILHLKITIFTAIKNRSILHRRVIVMLLFIPFANPQSARGIGPLGCEIVQYVNTPLKYTVVFTGDKTTIFR